MGQVLWVRVKPEERLYLLCPQKWKSFLRTSLPRLVRDCSRKLFLSAGQTNAHRRLTVAFQEQRTVDGLQ